MNKYKIKRIEIDNFKLIAKKKNFDFSNLDLVVFDGPNGFGKTTIFDAIEIALTGRIARLELYDGIVKNRSVKSGFPFINNPDREFYVKVEFELEGKSIIVSRYLDKDKAQVKDKGEIKWELIQLAILDSWEDSHRGKAQITQKQFEELFNLSNLNRIFNIFFYVQQEENTYFLKRSEKERKEHLDILFDVQKEKKISDHLNKLIKKIKDRKSECDKAIDVLSGKIKENEDSEEVKENQGKYLKLFDKIDLEWDNETFDLSSYKLSDLIEELDHLKNLVDSRTAFQKQHKSHQIKALVGNIEIIEVFLLKINFSRRLNELLEAGEERKTYENILGLLNSEKKYKVESWNNFKDLLENNKIVFSELVKALEELNSIKLHSTRAGNSLNEIKQFRKNLLNQHKEHSVLDKSYKEEECPFCGNSWGELQKLLDAYEEQSKAIETSNLSQITEKEEAVGKIFDKVQDSFEKKLASKPYPSDLLIQKLKMIPRMTESISSIEGYLAENNIVVGDAFQINDDNTLEKLEKSSELLLNSIQSKIESLETIEPRKYDRFVELFAKYFDSNIVNLQAFEVVLLSDKKQYLRELFSSYREKEVAEARKKIDDLKEKSKLFEDKQKDLSKILKIVKDAITHHISKIIIDISIPFYVYSGRILQEFNGGNGIFIRMDSRATGGVQFFSEVDRENDPLYTLSSGQISSLVLALCLTLNEVYSKNHSFGSVLIDDPIQTMDEINTVTFIDLLRYSFGMRQFFISTHEDNFSALVRYKFEQLGLNVDRVDMKVELQLP